MMFGAGLELRPMSISELMHVSERARRVEVFTGAGRRRNWAADEKAAIVAESYAPGRTVCGVARRHGLTPAQLFAWRRLARRARLPVPEPPVRFVRAAWSHPPRRAARPITACAFIAVRGQPTPRPAAPSCIAAPARPPARACDWHRGGDGRHRGSDRIGREPAGDRGGDPGAEGGTVIGPTGAVRVLMATRPVDFRKGADGLAALVRETMGADPFSGAVYVFRAKRADRVKLVFWDGTGVVLVAKRLEEGQFRWPKVQDGVMRLTAAELSVLLEGLDWKRVHAPRQVTVPAVPS